MDHDVQVAVYIDAETKAKLEEIKREHGVTTNAFIRLAIAERLREWDRKHGAAKRKAG